ncbi:MAG TPA: hypothetical protein VM187_13490 [Niastella sp.]|nr:hypothetical protein [Niastella sp.]
MAKLKGDFSFTGSMGNISVYKRHDIDEPIMRTKGGATKEKIKTADSFEETRRLNSEFGGRARTSRMVMRSIRHLKPMADYNIAGPINALLKHVQLLDTESAHGQRHVQLTKNPQLLEGFSLNKKRLFDSIIRSHINYTLSRRDRSVRIQVPALLPEINFLPQVSYPMFSLVVTLGIIPDVFYNSYGYRSTTSEYGDGYDLPLYTDWFPALKGSPEQTLELSLPDEMPDEAYSVIAGIGIRFGVFKEAGNIDQVPRAGSARVLAMA